jgi:hypothetical protein
MPAGRIPQAFLISGYIDGYHRFDQDGGNLHQNLVSYQLKMTQQPGKHCQSIPCKPSTHIGSER